MLVNKKNQRFFNITVGLLFLVFLSAVFLFLGNGIVHAQSANNLLWGDQSGNFSNATGLGSEDPRIIAARIIQIVLGFLGIIFLLLILYAGWLWMASGGSEDQISRAKRIITNATIGLIVMLMSFAIATFILNKLLEATNPGGGGATGPGSAGVGLGAIGSCTVASTYPAPNQNEVPRNAPIVITFREEIDPATICNDTSGVSGICDATDTLILNNVFIFKTSDPNGCPATGCAGNITSAYVNSTSDRKTFVISPSQYLGSASENTWYTVHFSNDIRKANGRGAFETCPANYCAWQFEVSNLLDLTPPQVVAGNVLPPPDSDPDLVTGTTAVAATGVINVAGTPSAFAPAGYGSISAGATVVIDPNNQQSGNLLVAIASDGLTARLNNGVTQLGAETIENNTVVFPGILTLTITAPVYSAGDSWTINGVTAVIRSDTLTVGSEVYAFVSGSAGPRQILVGGTPNQTAINIAAKLASHPQINATAAGNTVNLTAKVAGAEGNNIALSTNNATAITFTAASMANGADNVQTVTVVGRRDKPRNSIIQINFNEAMNPITSSGNAGDVWNYLRVVNNRASARAAGTACSLPEDCLSYDCTGGTCRNNYLDGKFTIANGYRTVEFISNNQCGVNGCGERIYCLPASSTLRVELKAAQLEGCVNCPSKTPFTNCSGHCADSAGKFYPKAGAFDGLIDMSMNSLDGDRSGDAEGPGVFYNENSQSGAGDDYLWSFYISDILDLTPPAINAITPPHNAPGVALTAPVNIDFSKVMSASSLGTGNVLINNGKNNIEHKLLNLWSRTGQALGYWTNANNVDNAPLDGEPDWTQAQILHSLLYDASSFRAQAGSGVKDIYQNCFTPSVGPGCSGIPSCCGAAGGINPTAAAVCP